MSATDMIVERFIANAVGDEDSKQKTDIVRAFITSHKSDTARKVSDTIVFGSQSVTTVAAALEDAKLRVQSGTGSNDEVEAQAALLKALTGVMSELSV